MSVVDFVFDQSASTSGDLVFGEIATGSSYAEITGSFQPLTAVLLALPGRDAQITGSFQPLTAALLALPGRDAQITGSFAPLTAAIRLKGSTTVAITGAFQPLSVSTLIGKISDAQITGSFADLRGRPPRGPRGQPAQLAHGRHRFVLAASRRPHEAGGPLH